MNSILGRLKSKLKTWDNVVILNKYCPTTKLCYVCGCLNNLTVRDRTFKCSCGECEDRDIHASKVLVWMYKNKVGMERTEFKRVELYRSIETAVEKQTSIEQAVMKHEGFTL